MKKNISGSISSRARSWDGDGHSQKLQIATVTKCFEQEENPYNLGKSAAKAKEATQSDSVPQQQDTQHHLAIPLHTSEASGFVGAFVRKSFTPLHTSTTLTDGVCCTSLHKRGRARQSEGEKAKGQTVPNPLQKRNPCRKNKKKSSIKSHHPTTNQKAFPYARSFVILKLPSLYLLTRVVSKPSTVWSHYRHHTTTQLPAPTINTTAEDHP